MIIKVIMTKSHADTYDAYDTYRKVLKTIEVHRAIFIRSLSMIQNIYSCSKFKERKDPSNFVVIE